MRPTKKEEKYRLEGCQATGQQWCKRRQFGLFALDRTSAHKIAVASKAHHENVASECAAAAFGIAAAGRVQNAPRTDSPLRFTAGRKTSLAKEARSVGGPKRYNAGATWRALPTAPSAGAYTVPRPSWQLGRSRDAVSHSAPAN